MASGQAATVDIVGSWRLISVTRREVQTGRVTQPMGDKPTGYIVYTPAGRIFAMLFAETRPKSLSDENRAELQRTAIAYSGTYTVDGTTATHHVDMATTPEWVGSDQVRHFALAHDRLTIISAPGPSAVDPLNVTDIQVVVTIVWERDERFSAPPHTF